MCKSLNAAVKKCINCCFVHLSQYQTISRLGSTCVSESVGVVSCSDCDSFVGMRHTVCLNITHIEIEMRGLLKCPHIKLLEYHKPR